MIEITGLKKSFGNQVVLDDINIKINKGDIYGLVGVSGAGKSTLLRCINGLEKFDNGSVIVDGVDVNNLSPKEMRKFRSKIGMIFQQFSLMNRKTVYQNVALPMISWGYPKEEIDKKVRNLLHLVDLDDKINAKPLELSGGQKQRVAIARALTMDPMLLLCDEATSALDPNITNSILELLDKINKELKITMIVVTHQMSVVKQLCNRMSFLSHGKLILSGNVEDIFIKKPIELNELLGTEKNILPKKGVNIELIFRNETERDLLTTMAIITNIPFAIVWGNFDRYRDNLAGTFVINCNEKHKIKLCEHLTQNNIEWRIVNQ